MLLNKQQELREDRRSLQSNPLVLLHLGGILRQLPCNCQCWKLQAQKLSNFWLIIQPSTLNSFLYYFWPFFFVLLKWLNFSQLPTPGQESSVPGENMAAFKRRACKLTEFQVFFPQACHSSSQLYVLASFQMSFPKTHRGFLWRNTNFLIFIPAIRALLNQAPHLCTRIWAYLSYDILGLETARVVSGSGVWPQFTLYSFYFLGNGSASLKNSSI